MVISLGVSYFLIFKKGKNYSNKATWVKIINAINIIAGIVIAVATEKVMKLEYGKDATYGGSTPTKNDVDNPEDFEFTMTINGLIEKLDELKDVEIKNDNI